MPYDSIVCVKQVPDTANVTAEAMKEDGTVNRAALPTIFNPGRPPRPGNGPGDPRPLRRNGDGGEHGPAQGGRRAPRMPLPRGGPGDPLTDRRAAASDTLATSYILSQAVRTIGRYDFVFCGRQAIDGDTAQVGPQCAEKLGIPQITYLEKLVEHSRRQGPHPPEHGPRLGGRRGQAAGAGDGDRDGQRAAAAGGEAGDAAEASPRARRSAAEVKAAHAARPPTSNSPPRPSGGRSR